MPVKVGGVSLLRSEVFVPRRFFGRLREVVVADRVLVEVCRSGGYHDVKAFYLSQHISHFPIVITQNQRRQNSFSR